MIGRFTKTTVEDWTGRDCCRLDFRGTDTRSPYCGDPELWDDEGDYVPLSEIYEYIHGRKTLEGIILGGEPLRSPNLYTILKELKKSKAPIRLETNGNRPLEVDDYAGALMIDCVAVRLFASPWSDSFSRAMPGIDPGNVSDTLDLLSGLEVMTEVELVAIPGVVTGKSVKEIARTLGKKTVFTIRQFDVKRAPEKSARELIPYTRSEASALFNEAKRFTNKAALKGF